MKVGDYQIIYINGEIYDSFTNKLLKTNQNFNKNTNCEFLSRNSFFIFTKNNNDYYLVEWSQNKVTKETLDKISSKTISFETTYLDYLIHNENYEQLQNISSVSGGVYRGNKLIMSPRNLDLLISNNLEIQFSKEITQSKLVAQFFNKDSLCHTINADIEYSNKILIPLTVENLDYHLLKCKIELEDIAIDSILLINARLKWIYDLEKEWKAIEDLSYSYEVKDKLKVSILSIFMKND